VLNIAGVQLLAPFSDGRSDEWRTLLDVNVFGLCVVIHQSLRYLTEAGGGDIVNMSSIAGRRVTGGTAPATPAPSSPCTPSARP
jgi:NADP-dependent 3-hydroxy acid dehydrogenase YdfG